VDLTGQPLPLGERPGLPADLGQFRLRRLQAGDQLGALPALLK
jgi:hypothetical protein